MSLDELFDRSYIPEPNTGCWVWIHRRLTKNGYGSIGNDPSYAHRFSYERFKGPIQQGLTIDHLCRLRCCVNPDHLEVVSQGENIRRSDLVGKWDRSHITHCPRGHEYSLENTRWVGPNGNSRQCKECCRIRQRRGYRKSFDEFNDPAKAFR